MKDGLLGPRKGGSVNYWSVKELRRAMAAA